MCTRQHLQMLSQRRLEHLWTGRRKHWNQLRATRSQPAGDGEPQDDDERPEYDVDDEPEPHEHDVDDTRVLPEAGLLVSTTMISSMSVT